jgi:hypothetical protein
VIVESGASGRVYSATVEVFAHERGDLIWCRLVDIERRDLISWFAKVGGIDLTGGNCIDGRQQSAHCFDCRTDDVSDQGFGDFDVGRIERSAGAEDAVGPWTVKPSQRELAVQIDDQLVDRIEPLGGEM